MDISHLVIDDQVIQEIWKYFHADKPTSPSWTTLISAQWQYSIRNPHSNTNIRSSFVVLNWKFCVNCIQLYSELSDIWDKPSLNKSIFRKSLNEGSEINKVQFRPLLVLRTLKCIQIFSMVSLCSEQKRLKYQTPVLSFFNITNGCHVIQTKDKNTKNTTSIKSRITAFHGDGLYQCHWQNPLH